MIMTFKIVSYKQYLRFPQKFAKVVHIVLQFLLNFMFTYYAIYSAKTTTK